MRVQVAVTRAVIAAAIGLALLIPAFAAAQISLDPPPIPTGGELTQTVRNTVTTVEGRANQTVTNAENTVNNVVDGVTGSGGNGNGNGGGSTAPQNFDDPGTGGPPSDSPPADSAPSIGTAAGSPQPAQGSGSAGHGDQPPATDATTGGGVPSGSAKAPTGQAAQRKPAPAAEPAKPAPTGFFRTVAAMPWSFFAACVGLAILGVLMAGRSALLARLSRRLTRQGEELREDVGALQDALLPRVPERLGTVQVSAAYRPAGGPAAGGDFHDVIPIDGRRTGVIVGDVSGHGRDALTVTALVHYTVRAYLETGMAPRDALRLADRALGGKLGDHFATVVAAVYDSTQGTLEYSSAGHPAPLLLGAGADHAVESMNAPPIGVGPPTGWRQTRVALKPGTRICFITDGLIEARRPDGEMVGRKRLMSVLEGLPEEAKAADALTRSCGDAPASDDLTLCLLAPEDARRDGSIVDELDLGGSQALRDGFEEFLVDCGLDSDEVMRAMGELRRLSRPPAPGLRLVIRRDQEGASWTIEQPHGKAPRTSVQAVVRKLERRAS